MDNAQGRSSTATTTSGDLPEPNARELDHQRILEYQGYERKDGLWDLEGELTDRKTFALNSLGRGLMAPGEPVHCMQVRLTVDLDGRIHDACAAMTSTPFDECLAATMPVQRLIGHRIGPGWRATIDAAMGGIRGCTHLRELLFGLGTLAYQTFGPELEDRARRGEGEPPTRHLDQCITWDRSSERVKLHRPEQFRPQREEGE